MLVRRIAMAATLGRESVVRRAEVGGRHDNRGPGDAPAEVLDAPDLEAGTADLAALEQGLAQPHRRHPVPALRQVAVPARAAHQVTGVGGGVVRGTRGSPYGERRKRGRGGGSRRVGSGCGEKQ